MPGILTKFLIGCYLAAVVVIVTLALPAIVICALLFDEDCQ